MSGRLKRIRGADRWIAWVRLGAIPFAIFQVAISGGYPPGYKTWAWVTTVLFVVGALALFWLAHREDARPARISARVPCLLIIAFPGRLVPAKETYLGICRCHIA